jgi:hypothetical protein
MMRPASIGARLALLLAAGLVLPATVAAQTTTSVIQGTVTDERGPSPGASIVARAIDTGLTYEATADAAGGFSMKGLRPARYEISVSMNKYKPQAKAIELPAGQTITLNFRVTPAVIYAEQVTVVGSESRLVESKTAEISTTVTEAQQRYLPQNQRNFLNFANLAPGVRVSDDETRKQVTAGGLDATAINVFIDGVSYKNDVLDGGVVGQDSSRGSPFPQAAVQEFQVLTQNYKAEHEKASSAVITAVTKSGTNQWHGDAFVLFQDKNLVSLDTYSEARDLPKPTYSRYQPGISVGGPLVRDRLFLFGAYEQNRQDRDSQVFPGGVTPPAGLDLTPFTGTFPSRFREDLPFVKGTWQPRVGQIVDLSYSLRNETDVRDFGNQTSFQAANSIDNRVDSVLARWNVPGQNWLNELTVTYQRSRWNPRPVNGDLVGQEFVGILRFGGGDTTQDFIQQRSSVRDDFTRFGRWNGTHAMKAGAVVSALTYDVKKLLNGNPHFIFRPDTNYAFPSQANYGFGNPALNANNIETGFFVQDDWTASRRLTLNLGLRWDYESDMLNNHYVTPPDVAQWATTNFNVNATQYVTDGNQRPPYYGAWQPRAGVAFDLTGEGRTVLFGGYGRYYDRVIYNAGLDERYRLQYQVLTFRFSQNGGPDPNGNPTLAWKPEYLSKTGLDAIVASGIGPAPEIYLIDNHTRPPVSDQFNAGVRTEVHGVLITANYAGIRGDNGFTFIFGNRNPDGSCCHQVPPYSNLLLSTDAKKNWYDAMYLTANRPFDNRWGMSVTYTLGRAEAIGGDLFSLDYLTPADYPRHPTSSDERNRIVATGIVGIRGGFIASGFLTLASGLGYTIVDATNGFAFGQTKVLLYQGRPDHNLAYRSLDLRLEKLFKVGGDQRVSAAIEAFNIFNYTNDNRDCTDGFIPPPPSTNPNFGTATCVVDNSTRRFQIGLRYLF